LKKGILFFVDNDPQGYKLSCCGSFGLDFFSFVKISFGHAVAGSGIIHDQQIIIIVLIERVLSKGDSNYNK
jgi:hypothetical protein